MTSTAQTVPRGMDCCALRRSPERLEPAMMPVTEGKKSAKHSVQSGSTVTTPVAQLPRGVHWGRLFAPLQCAVTLMQVAPSSASAPQVSSARLRK